MQRVVAEGEINHLVLGSDRELVEFIEEKVKGGDAARRGEPVGEAQRIVGEPVKRQLHLYEGGGRLHEVAERHFAGEISARRAGEG